jgi:2,4-diaminopentanoate dehydrogenase
MIVRVLHFGLGPIGCAVIRHMAGHKSFRSVGAIDTDPAKVGRDLGDVAELNRKLRVVVSNDVKRAMRAAKPDVVVLCTGSALRVVTPQVELILEAGVPIVSTAEELSYPVAANRRFASRIDKAARAAKVAVLATGVNPGFTMDALPIMLTAVCERVDSIEVSRVQDAAKRRLPFQLKIGAGLTRAQFLKKAKAGTVRHVGLSESISMIAAAMGWKLDRISDRIQAKIADRRVESTFLTVEAGLVCGLIQDGTGYRNGKPVIKLHMEAYLGAPASFDTVRINGMPTLSMTIADGVHGDIATASIVVNSIPRLFEVTPGLHTMRSMPLPSFFGVP